MKQIFGSSLDGSRPSDMDDLQVLAVLRGGGSAVITAGFFRLC